MAKAETPGGAEAPTKKKKAFKKRGEKRIVHHGFVHVLASFNNTLITITDAEGAVVSWSSAGAIGFKGSRKGTPFAATQAALSATNAAKTFGMRSCDVLVKGPGSGRESAIRALQTAGLEVRSIRDVTFGGGRHVAVGCRVGTKEAGSRVEHLIRVCEHESVLLVQHVAVHA